MDQRDTTGDVSVETPAPNHKVLFLFTIAGVIGGVFLLDGLFGIGDRYDLVLLSILLGLAVIGIGFWKGWHEFIGTIGLVLFSSALACVGCELILYNVIAESTVPEDWKSFERRIMPVWPKPVDKDKKEGVFRILGVSDSFGMHRGLNNYHWILMDSLESKKVPVELVNFSVSGYQPMDELQVVQRFAARYQPDLLLHGVYVGNDFQNTGGDRVYVCGLYLHRFTDNRAFRPKYFLFFKWIRWQVRLLKRAVYILYTSVADKPKRDFFTEDELMKTELAFLRSCTSDAPVRMKWDDTLAAIHGIQEEAAKMGARYVMVIHPDQCQVESIIRSRLIEEFHLNPETFDLELPQRYLMDDCRKAGVPCLDLLPAFREKGAGGGLYSRNDTHWNDEGNRLAAECIEEFLLSHGLIPLQKTE